MICLTSQYPRVILCACMYMCVRARWTLTDKPRIGLHTKSTNKPITTWKDNVYNLTLFPKAGHRLPSPGNRPLRKKMLCQVNVWQTPWWDSMLCYVSFHKAGFHYECNLNVPIGIYVCVCYKHLKRWHLWSVQMSTDSSNAENYIADSTAGTDSRGARQICPRTLTSCFILPPFRVVDRIKE